MTSRNILLANIGDVKEFVEITSRCDYDIDLVSGRYTVDAKSMIGIFSLDLSRPIKMVVHSEDAGELLEKTNKFRTHLQ